MYGVVGISKQIRVVCRGGLRREIVVNNEFPKCCKWNLYRKQYMGINVGNNIANIN